MSETVALRVPNVVTTFRGVSTGFDSISRVKFSVSRGEVHVFCTSASRAVSRVLSTYKGVTRKSTGGAKVNRIFCSAFLSQIRHTLFRLVFLIGGPASRLTFIDKITERQLSTVQTNRLRLKRLALSRIGQLVLDFPRLLGLR